MRIKIPREGHKNFSLEKSRIIAHLMADGCVFKTGSDYVIKYEVADYDLLEMFKNDVEKVYGLDMSKGLNPSGKTGRMIPYVRLRSKLVYEDIVTYGHFKSDCWKVPNHIFNSSFEAKREFLRAFFDDEGTVVISKNYALIRLYSINFKGLSQVRELLNFLGLDSKVVPGFGQDRNVYAIVIRDLNRFQYKIGFNSIRKKEKLREAINASRSPPPDLNQQPFGIS